MSGLRQGVACFNSSMPGNFALQDLCFVSGVVLAGVLTHLEGATPNRVTQRASLTSVTDKDFFTSGEDSMGNRTVGKTGMYFWYAPIVNQARALLERLLVPHSVALIHNEI
jgi:hypothetical protein